jgi:hypothetical protein
MDVEEKVPFERRSKRYRTKYFAALKELMGEANDTECQSDTNGSPRTDPIGNLVGENGH